MDVEFFLTERTKFIRAFYDDAISSFAERKRLIECEKSPFEPPYSEDGEPAFLSEWIDAEAGIELIGRTCVSMLSDSLKLYFSEWERQLGITCRNKCKKQFKERGFLHGFRTCFQQNTYVDWTNGPFDLDVIEQVILARNDSQHPTEITNLSVGHKGAVREGKRSLVFVREVERDLIPEVGSLGWSIMSPKIHVTRENLFEAIENIEGLVKWLEPQLFAVKYPDQN